MDNFNVILNIQDCIYSCNCKNCNSTNITVTNTSQTISLQNGYILNIIAVNNNFATILIQNGFQVIIRNIRDFPVQICIPTKCCTHVVTICANVSQV